MNEILPGVFHWTAVHPNLNLEVSSYLVTPGRVTALDPLLPEEGVDAFRGREPEQVVLSNRHHLRDAERLAEAFDCPILCNELGLHEFEDGPDVQGFSAGDEVSPGIRAHGVDPSWPDETVLQLDLADGVLAIADGLIHYGQVRFVSDEYLGDNPEEVKRTLTRAYARLLDLDFDHVLFAHGPPLVGGAKEALRSFLESRPS